MEVINGGVLFPKHGAKKLIDQIIGFGVEKHDDMVDAFTLLVLNVIKKHKNTCGTHTYFLSSGNYNYGKPFTAGFMNKKF